MGPIGAAWHSHFRRARRFRSLKASQPCEHIWGNWDFSAPDGYSAAKVEFLLIWGAASPRLFWLWDDDDVYECAVITGGASQRLSVDHQKLTGKNVGIVGCGSLGSKIATSLARSGVRNFLLVDDDLLLPENLVRNDLDWSGMGEHKADALARRLELVAPGVIVTVRRLRLGGQEASGAADWLLTRLQGCDLIIDATAEPGVFNLLAAVVHAAQKALIWVEVFAGGFGEGIASWRVSILPLNKPACGLKVGAQSAGLPRPSPRAATRLDRTLPQ